MSLHVTYIFDWVVHLLHFDLWLILAADCAFLGLPLGGTTKFSLQGLSSELLVKSTILLSVLLQHKIVHSWNYDIMMGADVMYKSCLSRGETKMACQRDPSVSQTF